MNRSWAWISLVVAITLPSLSPVITPWRVSSAVNLLGSDVPQAVEQGHPLQFALRHRRLALQAMAQGVGHGFRRRHLMAVGDVAAIDRRQGDAGRHR